MDTKNIDKTHIITLNERDGQLLPSLIAIKRPESFIRELEAIADNPNRTVWDMQLHFQRLFPISQDRLDYIYPNTYGSAFVGEIEYPEMYTYEDLRKTWESARIIARDSYLRMCANKQTEPEIEVLRQ